MVLRGLRTLRAVPDPVGVLRARQGIEIEHGLPAWMDSQVVRLAGAAPDAAYMLGIAPEIRDPAGQLGGHWDPVLRLVDGECLGLKARKTRITREGRQRALVFRVNPLEHARAAGLFEPLIGIRARVGCLRRARQSNDEEAYGDLQLHRGGPW